MVRVLIAALYYYPDQPTGSSRLAFDEARYLSGQGHEVWFLRPSPGGAVPEHEVRDGMHVLSYSPPRSGTWNPANTVQHGRRAKVVLARHVQGPVDVVHGHALVQYLAALPGTAEAARRAYSVHSPARLELRATARRDRLVHRARALVAGPLLNRMERRCLDRSTVVTANSEFTKSLIRRLHGEGAGDRVEVIPGWVDVAKFAVVPDRPTLKKKLGWPSDVPVLFTLRRLVPRMGLDRLLEAAREVRSSGPAFHLVVGGAGPLAGELASQARALGLGEVVRFLGRVPDEAVPELYGAADAFVLPSAELECFGLIALEAMSCGRPVLATPVGAIPEVVGRFEPAWLARDPSPGAIAELIAAWLRGELPSHDPLDLHAGVARRYAAPAVLARMATAVLGGG